MTSREGGLATVREAAEFLDVTERTIRNYLRTGLLTRVAVLVRGRQMGTRIARAELEQYRRDLRKKAS